LRLTGRLHFPWPAGSFFLLSSPVVASELSRLLRRIFLNLEEKMEHISKGALFGLIIAGIISGQPALKQLSDGSRAVMGDLGLNRALCVRNDDGGSH
jgi:hypothetical protein